MIFLSLKNEAVVQINDKTRLSAVTSFANGGDSITQVEIDPDNSGTFYDVTGNSSEDWFLDYVYSTNGLKTIALRINGTETKEFSINILSVAEDNLFSVDADIIAYESDLLNWVQAGRNSFLDKHRAAQIEILNDLDSDGIWKLDGTRYVASDIVDIQEFKEWSKFVTLRIIFESISNEIGDIFEQKAKRYEAMQAKAMRRAVLRLSPDGVEETRKIEVFSGDLIRV